MDNKSNTITKEKSSVRKGSVKNVIVTACAAVAVIIIAAAAGCFYVKGLDTIFPNVSVGGVPIGGLTVQEAADKLDDSPYADMTKNVRCSVALPNGSSVEVNGRDVGLILPTAHIAEIAYDFGRDGSLIGNAVEFLRCRNNTTDISSEVAGEMDEKQLESIVLKSVYDLEKQLGSAPYTVGKKSITIVKGAGKSTVDKDALYELVYSTLCKSLEKGAPMYEEYTLGLKESDSIDLKEIYDEVFVEPVKAEYDREKNAATKSVTGVSFDLKKAEKAYSNAKPGEKVEIELIYTEPEMTTDKLNELLFRDVLSEVTTSLSGSSGNRVNNVKLAAAALNGHIMAPGDQFSFNDVVGKRTTDKGYREAAAYVGGKTVQEVGGGICQVSSSVYCCVLYADLKTTCRYCHMFTVSYLPLGVDATVSWGAVDFCFENDKDYPIMIVTDTSSGSLTMKFLGTKLDDTYIDVDYEVVGVIGYEEEYKEDESVAPGEQIVDTSPHTGYIVDTYKYLYDGSGTLISKSYIDRSSYSSQNRIILVAPGEIPGQEKPPVDPADPPAGPTDPSTPPVDPQPADPPVQPVDPPPADPPADTPPATPSDEPVTPSETPSNANAV